MLILLIALMILILIMLITIHWLDRRNVRKQLDIMPTYHYVQNQGKLMMQSRENGQKHQFAQIYDNFEISTNCNFFWKIGFIQTEGRI